MYILQFEYDNQLWLSRIYIVMITNNKMKRYFLLLIFVLLLASCAQQNKFNNGLPVAGIKPEDAKHIAIEFLGNQETKNQYIVESAMVDIEGSSENSWLVYFKHINWENQRPSHGIVSVNRSTGEANWMLLR